MLGIYCVEPLGQYIEYRDFRGKLPPRPQIHMAISNYNPKLSKIL
jgi:hypothetical protein